jgi:hypothetical protein
MPTHAGAAGDLIFHRHMFTITRAICIAALFVYTLLTEI